jgi:hypothetical protein
MSVIRPEGSVGHDWEADLRPRYGSVPGMINVVVSHLWWVSPRLGAGSTRVAPFQHTQLPLPGPAMPSPRLGAAGFDQGWDLPGLAHLPLLTD